MKRNKKLRAGLAVVITILLITTFVPSALSNIGKTDLIIEDIKIEYDNQFPDVLYCAVKNIGDAKVEETIELVINVKQLLFGIIPIRAVKTFNPTYHGGGVAPGETINASFTDVDHLPRYGFYRFYCKVNPDEKIDESNYRNNFYRESFLRLGILGIIGSF